MGGISHLLQGFERRLNREWYLLCTQPRCANSYFFDRDTRGRRQRLRDSADAGAAMHSIDSNRELCQLSLPVS